MAQKLSGDDLAAASMSILLRRRYGVPVLEAEQVIKASLADAETAGLLQLPVGAPLPQIERIYTTRHARPLYDVHASSRADRYKHTVNLVQALRHRRAGRPRVARGV